MSLIKDLQGGKVKKAFQVYTIKHGIESFAVQVPQEASPQFEQAFAALKTTNKDAILQLVESVGGRVRNEP